MFERLLNYASNWVKNRFIYMTGRGLLSMVLLFGASLFVPGGTIGLGAIGLIVGVTAGLQAFVTYREEQAGEQAIVSEYREEIATRLGIHPAGVGKEHLQLLANGSLNRNIEPNAVLYQAIQQNQNKHLLRFVTTGFSAFAMASVLMIPGLVESLGSMIQNLTGGSFFEPRVPGVAAAMLISGTGMSWLNTALDQIGDRVMGLNRPTAHELIVRMKDGLERGRAVTKEQVFGVYVAADAGLAHAIEERFGKRYDQLHPQVQAQALEHYGAGYQIEQITRDINNRQIQVTELGFSAAGQASGVPRRAVPKPVTREQERSQSTHLIQEVRAALAGSAGKKKPANDNQHQFAKHFQPTESAKQSFVERVGGEREADAQSFIQREQQRRDGANAPTLDGHPIRS